jgi:hypothetical protein
VQDTVDEVTDEFGLPRRSELSRLLDGVVDANEDFSVELFRKVSGSTAIPH